MIAPTTLDAVPSLLFAMIPLLCKAYWTYRCTGSQQDKVQRTLLQDMCDMECEVLAPGLVIMKNALSMESQLLLAENIFEYGHRRRKWWEWTRVDKRDMFLLNNYRQGRGRIYDALSSYPGGGQGKDENSSLLRRVCEDSVALARQLDGAMPALASPGSTHLLTLYYTSARKLGWHRDNGTHDGQSLCPVVSISLGNACDFLYRNDVGEEARLVRLESGDVLLFGGPSRHILHTVPVVHQNTCPPPLQALHLRMLASTQQEEEEEGARTGTGTGQSPNPPPSPSPAPNSFRLNLTFRHAPELFGKESEERFYFFARSARKFLDLAKQLGVGPARQMANQERQAKRDKHPKRAAKSKKKKNKKNEENINSNSSSGSSSGSSSSGRSNSSSNNNNHIEDKGPV